MKEKKPLVVLTGPTAVGKTKLSIALAKLIKGEIISADSMQVYKGMDIGSAKIREDEMEGVPHHLIDILEPTEDFNVVIFQEKCKKAMEEIYQRGNIPILTGGTGFYIQAIVKDILFSKEENNLDENSNIREELEIIATEKGALFLNELLREVDPVSADTIHVNNVKRTIRAIEFHRVTGEKISEHNEKEKEKQSPYNLGYFVLNDKRDVLYQRINNRVEQMIRDGLVSEVKKLLAMGCNRDMISMQGLGYKEIIDYLNETISLEEAISLIKRDTRHFAKRQITWFKREENVIWLTRENTTDDVLLMQIIEHLKCKNMIE